MNYHLCYSNPQQWRINYQTGVYGNVGKGDNNLNTFWGKLCDLTAVTSGDRVFFYIKEAKLLYGVFRVVGEPYYCKDNLFNDSEETYPHRFNFKEEKHFQNPIPLAELAKLIQTDELFSLATFERDIQGQFRGIRQFTKDEASLLERVLLKYNPKGNLNDLKQYHHPTVQKRIEAKDLIDLAREGKIDGSPFCISMNTVPPERKRGGVFLSKYENALQGYIYYSMRRKINGVTEALNIENFTESLMEVPLIKSQQFRSDILCLYRDHEQKPHFYSLIEIKKDKVIEISHLSQLIGYMKLFADSYGIPFNSLEGIYISNDFSRETIDYLKNRKKVENENPVRLIRYTANDKGKVTLEQEMI